MKLSIRSAAQDDLVRQVRYYLVEMEVPSVALRFEKQVRNAIELIRSAPYVGPSVTLKSRRFPGLRSWPVHGFPFRIYYICESGAIEIVRILHGKRDVRKMLER